MDDIFNILFFVVTIVVFIVSALRKSKKGTQKPKSSIQSTLESLFDIPQEEPKTILNDFVQQVEVKTPEVSKTVKRKTIIENNTEGASAIPDKIRENEISNNEVSEPLFNLRSAIIYKEILNRKEF